MTGKSATITKSEIENLQHLVRQRERVQKSAAKQRSADLLADFENQMASEFSFDDDTGRRQKPRLKSNSGERRSRSRRDAGSSAFQTGLRRRSVWVGYIAVTTTCLSGAATSCAALPQQRSRRSSGTQSLRSRSRRSMLKPTSPLPT